MHQLIKEHARSIRAQQKQLIYVAIVTYYDVKQFKHDFVITEHEGTNQPDPALSGLIIAGPALRGGQGAFSPNRYAWSPQLQAFSCEDSGFCA